MEYFDTLAVYDRLAKAGPPDAASRALSEVFKEQTQQQVEVLATKKDIEEIKTSIIGGIEVLRLTTQKDIADLKSTAETKILESKVDAIKWVVGLMVAQSAIIITSVGVLVKLLK
ncbi:MAG: hypothetical protein HQK57_01280 [Deltaproteobacteria bacterium]|nr:hypothetical protein [Deltaproteobacteria bacterium]